MSKPKPPDPNRVVRGRLTIQLPFTDISGNVYGKEVSSVPTAFITIFERAVARALFCGNPPLATSASTYVDEATGQPLCNVKMDFEMHKNRVQVLTVVEGSIIVDFLLTRNVTEDQSTAPQLFAALQELLTKQLSPLCQDAEFGRFARAASVVEVDITEAERHEMDDALTFEQMRQDYDAKRACNLDRDHRDGAIVCPTSGASRCFSDYLLTWLFAIVVLVFIPAPAALFTP